VGENQYGPGPKVNDCVVADMQLHLRAYLARFMTC